MVTVAPEPFTRAGARTGTAWGTSVGCCEGARTGARAGEGTRYGALIAVTCAGVAYCGSVLRTCRTTKPAPLAPSGMISPGPAKVPPRFVGYRKPAPERLQAYVQVVFDEIEE